MRLIVLAVLAMMMFSGVVRGYVRPNLFSVARISSKEVPSKHIFKQKALRAVGAKKMHRLERIISNRGLGSRGEVGKMLKQGLVVIEGKVVKSGKAKYPIDVEVEVDGEAVNEIPLMACYHKPVGVHSTLSDNWGRADLQDLQEQFTFLKTMHPVGRLDADTSGLLLFCKVRVEECIQCFGDWVWKVRITGFSLITRLSNVYHYISKLKHN